MASIKTHILKFVLDRREVEFLCSPKLEGIVTTAVGGALTIAFVTYAIVHGRSSLGLMLALIAIGLALTAYGIYYWLLRTRPIKRTVTPGNLSFRLYHTNLLVYAVYLLVNAALVGMLLTAAFAILDGEFTAACIRSHIRHGLYISAVVLLEYLRTTLTIYQYDRSPAETRRYVDGQSLGNNGTPDTK